MPTVNYCDHGPGCPDHTIRVDFPITPEAIELREVFETGGEAALVARHKQQQRNQRRRQVAIGRKRYAAIALEKNMRIAAERLAERKLAERDAQERAKTSGVPSRPILAGWVFYPQTTTTQPQRSHLLLLRSPAKPSPPRR